jgi:hypothetical protein
MSSCVRASYAHQDKPIMLVILVKHFHYSGQPISQNGKRYDFHVYNNRKLKILCSYFSNNHNSTAPCLVYLHSLNGSRL